mmetsp:Transcript_109515/g.353433  ORF Transcript_109515/g.353433 Transcript_109515/m.353433 type:complete len:282 (+) Transcript_109515:1446-2291(+)
MASSIFMPFLRRSWRSLMTPAFGAVTVCLTPSEFFKSAMGSPSSIISLVFTCHFSKDMPAGIFVAVCPASTFNGGNLPTIARLLSGRASSRFMPSLRSSWMAVTTPPVGVLSVCATPAVFVTSAIGSPVLTVSPTLTMYFLNLEPEGAVVGVFPGWTGSAAILPMVAMLRSSAFSTGSPGLMSSCTAITVPSFRAWTVALWPPLPSSTSAMASPFFTTSPFFTWNLLRNTPSGAVVGVSDDPHFKGDNLTLSITTRALSSNRKSILSPWSSSPCVVFTVPR